MTEAESDRWAITEFVNCLGIGGTERQLVEQLHWLDRTALAVDLCCLQKVGEFLPVVRSLSLEPTEFPLRGTLLRPNTAIQISRLARHLRSNHSRLLHAHDFYSNLIGAAAATLARIPYVISRRDMGAWLNPIRAEALAAVTRRAPFVLCNAYAIRDRLVNDEGVDPTRITVVYNGIDLEQFDKAAAREPEQRLPILDGPGPIITLVANMKHEIKGHDEMLHAANVVLTAMPDARFLLIGDGALRPRLEALARKLGIAHATTFAGRREDVPALLARSHIAICSSRSEGLSNAIIEAMAARLPVVATSVGGNMELVRDGRSGFLVREQDAGDLSRRILEIARNPLLARKMGLAGRRHVEEELTARKMGDRMNSLYGRILRIDGERRRAA